LVCIFGEFRRERGDVLLLELICEEENGSNYLIVAKSINQSFAFCVVCCCCCRFVECHSSQRAMSSDTPLPADPPAAANDEKYVKTTRHQHDRARSMLPIVAVHFPFKLVNINTCHYLAIHIFLSLFECVIHFVPTLADD
jgi:hypothetical protein